MTMKPGSTPLASAVQALEIRNYDDVIKILKEVSPKDAKTLELMGKAYEGKNEFEYAIEYYERAVSLGNNELPPILGIVRSLLQHNKDKNPKRLAEAQAWLERAEERFGSSDNNIKEIVLLWFQLFDRLGRGDFKKLIEFLKEKLEKYPRIIELHLRYLDELERENKLKSITNHFEKYSISLSANPHWHTWGMKFCDRLLSIYQGGSSVNNIAVDKDRMLFRTHDVSESIGYYQILFLRLKCLDNYSTITISLISTAGSKAHVIAETYTAVMKDIQKNIMIKPNLSADRIISEYKCLLEEYFARGFMHFGEALIQEYYQTKNRVALENSLIHFVKSLRCPIDENMFTPPYAKLLKYERISYISRIIYKIVQSNSFINEDPKFYTLPESINNNVKEFTKLPQLMNSIAEADTYLLIYDKLLRIDFTRLSRNAVWYLSDDRKYFPVLFHWIIILFGNLRELPPNIKSELGNPTVAEIAYFFFIQTLELVKLKTKVQKEPWQVIEPQFTLSNEKVSLWETLLYYQQMHTGFKPGSLVKSFTIEDSPPNLMEPKQITAVLENIRKSPHFPDTYCLMGTVFANLDEDESCQKLAIKLLHRCLKTLQEDPRTRTSEARLTTLKCNSSLLMIADNALRQKDYPTVLECLSDLKTYSALMLLGRAIKDQDEPSSLVDSRLKFLSAADAEDATVEQREIARKEAQECRLLMSEEKIEKARQIKRQSRKNPPLLRRNTAHGLSNIKSLESGSDVSYTTPVKPNALLDTYNSPLSGFIVPASPRGVESPSESYRQKVLRDTAHLQKNFNNDIYPHH